MPNTFSFTNVKVNKVFDNKGGITLAIQDTKAVSEPDGSFRSVFVCSRLVGTNNADLMKFIRSNIVDNDDVIVNITGYHVTRTGKKPGEWYDNMVATELTLA